MNPPVKVAAFAASLALAFAASFGVARAVAPDALADRDSGGHGAGHTAAPVAAPDTGAHGAGHGGSTGAAAPVLHGLQATQDGYSLVPESSTLTAGEAVRFRFRITGASGQPVTSYRMLHEREVHLIVVRRDLTGFQHVHPTRGPDGTWTAELRLPAGGTWRAFTDLSPERGPEQLTLGIDLQVAGPFQPGGLPTAVTATTDDVTFARTDDRITVTVNRAGTLITPEPYLGARGHLVAIRAGDLGYAHVHPEESAGPGVAFAAHLPAGSYTLFFDYQSNDVVTTATSTLEVQR